MRGEPRANLTPAWRENHEQNPLGAHVRLILSLPLLYQLALTLNFALTSLTLALDPEPAPPHVAPPRTSKSATRRPSPSRTPFSTGAYFLLPLVRTEPISW